MPTDLPTSAKQALAQEQLADELAMLVTIEDSSLSAPLRYTSSNRTRLSSDPLQYGIVSQGETFVYALRNPTLPNDIDDAQTNDIVIDNIVENVAPLVRALTGDATVTQSIVLTSLPDSRFAVAANLRIVDRAYDMETVTLTVSRHANRPHGADSREPLSGERQTFPKAPGLHR